MTVEKAPPNIETIDDKFVKGPIESGITWDDKLTGFGLRVNVGKKQTSKAFIFGYRIDGRERRMTLGRYPAWSAALARDRVKELRRDVDNGIDPLGKKEEARDADTVADIWAHYAVNNLVDKRPASQRGDKRFWTIHIQPAIGRRKAHTVQKADVSAIHRKMNADTPVQANRVLSLISILFNHAITDMELPIKNPAVGVKRATEDSRERYLNDDEHTRLLETLADYPYLKARRLPKSEYFEQSGKIIKSKTVRHERADPELQQSADILRLIMLTGCRKHEALSATWSQFDLVTGIWTKPSAHTKQNKIHRAPLSKAALVLLGSLKENADNSEYVFPGKLPDTHQKDVKSAWETIRHRAGILDVRIHDLRHQFASVLASAGQSLPVIGRLLGHTQSKTTERYAHLFDDPLRAAVDAAGAIISGEPAADVIDIKEGRK